MLKNDLSLLFFIISTIPLKLPIVWYIPISLKFPNKTILSSIFLSIFNVFIIDPSCSNNYDSSLAIGQRGMKRSVMRRQFSGEEIVMPSLTHEFKEGGKKIKRKTKRYLKRKTQRRLKRKTQRRLKCKSRRHLKHKTK